MQVRALIETLATTLYKKGLFGFFTLDLLAFADPFDNTAPFTNSGGKDSKNTLFWANSLSTYYGDLHSAYILCSVLTGRFENNLDKYITVFPHLPYSCMPTSSFKAFFQSTRLENIYFDVAAKAGSLFLVSQQLQRGMIGLVCVDSTEDAVLLQALKSLGFLKRQTSDKKSIGLGEDAPSDLNSITEIFGKIKMEVKRLMGGTKAYNHAAKIDKMKV